MVETGYENVLLVRLLLEMKVPAIQKSSVGTCALNSHMTFVGYGVSCYQFRLILDHNNTYGKF